MNFKLLYTKTNIFQVLKMIILLILHHAWERLYKQDSAGYHIRLYKRHCEALPQAMHSKYKTQCATLS